VATQNNKCEIRSVLYGDIEEAEHGRQQEQITIFFQGGVNHANRVAIANLLDKHATVQSTCLVKTSMKGVEMVVRTTPANIGLEVQRLIALVQEELRNFTPKVTPSRSRRGHRRGKTLADEPFPAPRRAFHPHTT
jgi:hypothetical protein